MGILNNKEHFWDCMLFSFFASSCGRSSNFSCSSHISSVMDVQTAADGCIINHELHVSHDRRRCFDIPRVVSSTLHFAFCRCNPSITDLRDRVENRKSANCTITPITRHVSNARSLYLIHTYYSLNKLLRI